VVGGDGNGSTERVWVAKESSCQVEEFRHSTGVSGVCLPNSVFSIYLRTYLHFATIASSIPSKFRMSMRYQHLQSAGLDGVKPRYLSRRSLAHSTAGLGHATDTQVVKQYDDEKPETGAESDSGLSWPSKRWRMEPGTRIPITVYHRKKARVRSKVAPVSVTSFCYSVAGRGSRVPDQRDPLPRSDPIGIGIRCRRGDKPLLLAST
jgi:hypothetical protein